MFSRSTSALPPHAPRAHGASRATDLYVSLAIDSASNFVGAALYLLVALHGPDTVQGSLASPCGVWCSQPLQVDPKLPGWPVVGHLSAHRTVSKTFRCLPGPPGAGF